MSSEKKVVAGLSLRADQFKQELESVRALEKQASDEGQAFARSFSEGFTRIEERALKMSSTLANGGDVNKKTFKDTISLLAQMEAAATAGGKSIEEAPEPIRKAFEVARQQLTAVSAQMQVSAASTDALRDRIMQAGAQAAGLATAVQGATAAVHAMSDAEQRAAELAEEVEKKFGDIPAQIDEIKKAGDRTFDEQVEDLEAVAKKLKDAEKSYSTLGAEGAKALDALRPKAAQVQAAMAELAANGASHAGRVSDAVLLTGRAFDNLAQQIRKNPKEAVESLPKAAGAVIGLRKEIEAAQKAGGPVDPQAVATLKKFETQLASAKREVKELKTEIDREVAGWQGLDSVVNGLAGRFGKLGTGVVGGLAAIREGWQLGHQIAEKLGTDFSAMEQMIEKWQAKAKGVNSAILGWLTGDNSFEAVRASVDLTKEQFEGYNSAMLAGIENIGNIKDRTADFNEIHAAHTVILAEGNEGQRLATQAKREGGGVLEDYVRSLELATEAARVHHELTLKGAEGEQLWIEIREKGKASLLDLVKAIREKESAIAAIIGKTKEEIEAEKALQAVLNDSTKLRVQQLEMEKQQAELVANQEKAEDGLTQAIRNKLAEITASMTVKEGREIPLTKLQIQQLETLIAQNITLTETERKKLQARVDQLKGVETLTQAQREMLAQDIQIDLQRNSSIQTDEQHRVVLDRKSNTISNAAAQTGLLTDQITKTTAAEAAAHDGAAKLDGGFGRLGGTAKTVETGVRGIGQGLGEVAKQVDLAADPIERISKITITLGEALQKAGEQSEHLKIAPDTIENLGAYDKVLGSVAGHLKSIVQDGGPAIEMLNQLGSAATQAAGGGAGK